MATINLATRLNSGLAASTHMGRLGTHYIETTVDLAAALIAKGSALAAADVIQALNVPAGSVILAAGIEVLTAPAGGGSVLTFNLGTTTTAAAYAAGFDAVAAAVGAYSAGATAGYPIVVGNTPATIDLVIATQTGVYNSGTFRIFAIIADVQDQRKPGITQLKS